MLWAFLLTLWTGACLGADTPRLTAEDRLLLIRGLTAEYATAKAPLPRSKKALPFESTGAYDKRQWDAIGKEFGPAARVGDLVQVTKVDIADDRIVLEINGGFRGGRKWYERVEVGVGSRSTPLGRGQSNAPGGTSIALLFLKSRPPLKPEEVKKMLAPVLDFERRSATRSFLESLPPPMQAAVKEKRALEGMDRDTVLLALGKPVRKVRETVDGEELEDWIYGAPPGKITFVTFQGNKVVRVKETYAGLGTEAPRLPVPR